MPEPSSHQRSEATWLGLVIGNTRLHWGLWHGQTRLGVWHTPHLSLAQANDLLAQGFAISAWRSLAAHWSLTLDLPAALTTLTAPPPLDCASVVPTQTALWQAYPGFRNITLADVPLQNLYPTLGIDRALNLLGAGDRYGWPVLVIDAGTALTFTAGAAGQLVGGAILPGLSTQFAALTQSTAVLPNTPAGALLPPRWATNTPDAIRSGILYGTLATLTEFREAWRRDYPAGKVVLTGGDGAQLYHWWSQQQPLDALFLEPDLTFWGLLSRRRQSATDR